MTSKLPVVSGLEYIHKELRPGLLRKILKDAELTVEEFIQLL